MLYLISSTVFFNDSNIFFNNYCNTHPRPVLHIFSNHSKTLSNVPVFQFQFPAPHSHSIQDQAHKHCIGLPKQNNGRMTCLKLSHCIRIYRQSSRVLRTDQANRFDLNIQLTFFTSTTCFFTVFFSVRITRTIVLHLFTVTIHILALYKIIMLL